MPVRTHLAELHELLAAFLERPESGVLVVRCTDDEILYLVHTLEQLDAACPADRFFVAPDFFEEPGAYLDALTARIAAESTEPDTAVAPLTTASLEDPLSRLRVTIHELLADLPAGDHRLVCALVPARIEDLTAFTELFDPLLTGPFPTSLRLVLREDPRRPLSAETCPSVQVLAYNFCLPASVVVESTAAASRDPSRHPDERAQAILQLAVRDIGFGHHDRALAACDAAAELARNPAIVALAFALRADALRAADHLGSAVASANEALRRAVDAQALPIIHHSAMALGDLACRLGRPEDAAACFTLAERAAAHNPSAQALARERLAAIQPETPC